METTLSSELSVGAILLLGFLLGLQHATEADHLAAVTTIVGERKNLVSAMLVGGLWGAGHTLTILIVGALAILFKFSISTETAAILEAGVGVMLILLGINLLWRMRRGAAEHSHEHHHDNNRGGSSIFGNARSFVVGMIHGLAGSAALILLVVPAISSPAVALGYLFIFGVGSIGGMMMMSLLVGLPFRLTAAARFVHFNRVLQLIAALFSTGFGCYVIYENLFAA